MKKTLVTEKSGVSRLPPAAHALIRTPDTNNREREVSALTIKNKQLESDLFRVMLVPWMNVMKHVKK